MPSFRSSRQSSRSQQQKQLQQQNQQPLDDQSSAPGPGRGFGSSPDTGSLSAPSSSTTDLPAFDPLQDDHRQGLIQHPAVLAPGLSQSSSARLPSCTAPAFEEQQPQSPLHKSPFVTKQSDQDYQDQVSRSQSPRYPNPAVSSQANQHYASSPLNAASVDSLSQSLQPSSPLVDQPPQLPPKEQLYHQQAHREQQQQLSSPPQPPPLVQEPVRTTRKLFKNFLGGSSREKRSISNGRSKSQQQQPPPPPPLPPLSPSVPLSDSRNVQSSNVGLVHRLSKRLSEQPISPRTVSLQASAPDNSSDWPLPNQHQQRQGPQYIGSNPTDISDNIHSSSLQGTGEALDNGHEGFQIQDSNQPPPPTIRRVLTDELNQQKLSPYEPEDSDEYSNSYSEQRGGHYASPSEQLLSQQEQQGYGGQGVLDPQQPQPRQHKYPALHYHRQAGSTKNPHHSFIGHLGRQHQQQQQQHSLSQQQHPGLEAISQSLHEPSGGDTDVDQLAAQTFSSGGNSPPNQEAQGPIQGQQTALQDLAPIAPLAAQLQADNASQVPQKPQKLQNAQVPLSQGQDTLQSQQAMPPQQAGGLPSGRRSQDISDRTDTASGNTPSVYRHSQNPSSGFTGSSNPHSLPPLPAGSSGTTGGPVQGYQRSGGEQRQYESMTAEGRNSPQLSIAGERGTAILDPEKALKELALKYKNVKRLYFEGKILIDQLTGQIEHLQNTIASQRMSQSRTALDDSEYATRFNRLNGAINNMSFNIRKDWVALPSWIEPYASPDALKTGKQEMTAVGRAIICRWVVESIFDRCFHPCLDPELSFQLKEIEHNIRRSSHNLTSQEESDSLTDKIVSWRMTTLEGLQNVLSSTKSSENRVKFIQQAVSDLTSYLCHHMADPPPPGLDGSAVMIVELAVGIASSLPLESRDVVVTLPLPLDYVAPHLMDVEKAGLPSLDTRPADDGGDQDVDDEYSDDALTGEDESGGQTRRSHPRNEILTVRFAGFVAVEVRGRQVLNKASVWTL